MSNFKAILSHHRLVITVVLAAYVVVYMLLRQVYGTTVTALIALPVALIAWWSGRKVGLIALVCAVGLNALLMAVMGDKSFADGSLWVGSVFGTLVLLVFTLSLGAVHDLNEQLRQELIRRQASEQMERQRSAELAALHNASLLLTSSLELKPVLSTIMQQVTALLSAPEVHIFLYDGEKLTFGGAIWKGEERVEPLRVPREGGLTATVARTRQRQTIIDLATDPITRDRGWTGALVSVPLAVGDVVYGVMNIGFEEAREFGENELRIIQLLADQATLALRNARSYETARQYAEALEQRVIERTAELRRAKDSAEALVLGQRKVLALTYELISSPDIDTLWKRAVEKARSVLEIERCSIFIERDGFMVGTYGTNLRGETTDEHRQTFFKGERSWSRLEQVFTLDTPSWDVEYSLRQEWNGEQMTDLTPGWIAVTPIHSAYRFIGIFYNDAAISGAPLDEIKQEILAIFCSLLGSLYEHKRVEDDIRRALEREKELSELKSRFTSMISHELRTPLSTIQLSSDILKTYANRLSETATHNHVDKIQAQVKHLTNLLEDVLTFTRAEGVGLQPQLKNVDVKAFCAELSAEVQATHPSHQLIFADCPGMWIGSVDAKLLRQALLNLLLNAIKYSPSGSLVTLALERDGKDVMIKVADHGIGIPEGDLPHVFDVFYRAKNVGAAPGTGLGLALVRQIAEAHHGFVFCESRVNAGTTFTFRFSAFP